jgi:hypothetical protein
VAQLFHKGSEGKQRFTKKCFDKHIAAKN